MTGEEKRKKLKEQYKRDLKLRKEFLEKAKGMERMRKLNKNVQEITGALSDDTHEWIEKLNRGTAIDEARADMVFDEKASDQALEKLAKEAEAERFNAQNLVDQMKREMGLLEEEELMEGTENLDPAEPESKKKAQPDKDPPSRRLGDF